MTLDELFQLEKHLEDNFETILSKCGCPVYRTRDTDINVSPRIEMHVTIGEVLEHQHVFPSDLTWIRNGWAAKLETQVVTNRTETENRTQAHQRLIGLHRKVLQHYAAIGVWNANSPVLLGMIREQGTDDTFSDEKDLDYTKINWALLFSLNPSIVNATATTAT